MGQQPKIEKKKWSRKKKFLLLFFLLFVLPAVCFYCSSAIQSNRWQKFQAEFDHLKNEKKLDGQLIYKNRVQEYLSGLIYRVPLKIDHTYYVNLAEKVTVLHRFAYQIAFSKGVVSETLLETLPSSNRVENIFFYHIESEEDLFSQLLKFPNVKVVSFRGSRTSFEHIHLLGELKNLIGVDLAGTKITDADLMKISGLTNLGYILLWNTKVSDEMIPSLLKNRNLNHLDLTKTKITDEGIRVLSGNRSINALYLDETSITDECVEDLMKMKNLKLLSVSGTKISPKGIEKLESVFKRGIVNTIARAYRY